MTTGILQDMTIEDVRAFDPQVAMLALGSTEPHGPALPYGTDFFQVDHLCRRAVTLANEQGARAIMYPTLAIGNNVNFKQWPMACRVSVRTLMLVVLDIIQALEEDGIRKIVLVNGHGGNTDTIAAILREHFDRTPPERRAFVCTTWGAGSEEAYDAIEHPSMHGGEFETSLMMHVRGDLVRTDKLQDQPFGKPITKRTERPEVSYVRPWHGYAPLSAGGEQRKATAAKGENIIESTARNIADLLIELGQTPWHQDFPYPLEA